MNSNFEVITFGCRLNIYESEVIKKILYENNILDENQGIVIFNSCAVTKEAERQLKQSIRKIRKERPSKTLIGVVGCAVQINKEEYINMPEVDFILGNNDKLELSNYKQFTKKYNKVSDILENNYISNQIIENFEGKSRAFVQIQNGCDNKCTFCVTRLARGYSVSVKPEIVVDQIKRLIDNNYKEIVLTGINISDYGNRLDENINLGQLIIKILQETSVERLRLSSLDISDINMDLINVIKYEKRLMPHIHLSLQSGDNIILKRMMRRHTREEVFKKCYDILSIRPEIIIGADLIAGFPTETEEMHRSSVDIVKNLPITYGHIFHYSERPNTKAALMPQVNKKIRKNRAKELRMLAEFNLNNLKDKIIGTKQKVLIETTHLGRLENYLQIELNSDYSKQIGKIIEILV